MTEDKPEGREDEPDKYAQLEEILADFRTEKDLNLVQILHRVQTIFGHVSREIQVRIAEGLNIPLSEIYSVVSFYSLFTTDAQGETTIEVCMGTACYVKGADDILEALKTELEIEPGQTTDDNQYSLVTTRCVGACGKAPVVIIDDEMKGNLSPDEVIMEI